MHDQSTTIGRSVINIGRGDQRHEIVKSVGCMKCGGRSV